MIIILIILIIVIITIIIIIIIMITLLLLLLLLLLIIINNDNHDNNTNNNDNNTNTNTKTNTNTTTTTTNNNNNSSNDILSQTVRAEAGDFGGTIGTAAFRTGRSEARLVGAKDARRPMPLPPSEPPPEAVCVVGIQYAFLFVCFCAKKQINVFLFSYKKHIVGEIVAKSLHRYRCEGSALLGTWRPPASELGQKVTPASAAR